MHIDGLRSPYEKVGGLVFFGRMLDKIRLHARDLLPADYNLGHGLDGRMCRFLQVEYADVAEQALMEEDDLEMLEWCFIRGRRPSEEEIFIFNAFMEKRGWRDDMSAEIQRRKDRVGLGQRDDLQTCFDLHDADEGRK